MEKASEADTYKLWFNFVFDLNFFKKQLNSFSNQFKVILFYFIFFLGGGGGGLVTKQGLGVFRGLKKN